MVKQGKKTSERRSGDKLSLFLQHGNPPFFAEDAMFPGSLTVSLPSAARLSGSLPDPWLCVTASRRLCPYREGVLAL